jgi:hypothetical protein
MVSCTSPNPPLRAQRVPAVAGSFSGPNRQFAAAQQDVCNGGQTGRSLDAVTCALTERGRFPVDRDNLNPHLPIEIVGVLPYGTDRLFIGASRALDAVVAEA